VPALATVDASASVPAAATDLLLSGEASCARISSIISAIEADSDTVALKSKITTFLEATYFPRLRVLLSDAAATAD
jgi:hypothetical protein